MRNYEYLKIGDTIKETDEIQHRGHWESVTEHTFVGKVYGDGMKKIRRRIEIDILK
jgi:hypothetical protein